MSHKNDTKNLSVFLHIVPDGDIVETTTRKLSVGYTSTTFKLLRWLCALSWRTDMSSHQPDPKSRAFGPTTLKLWEKSFQSLLSLHSSILKRPISEIAGLLGAQEGRCTPPNSVMIQQKELLHDPQSTIKDPCLGRKKPAGHPRPKWTSSYIKKRVTCQANVDCIFSPSSSV